MCVLHSLAEQTCRGRVCPSFTGACADLLIHSSHNSISLLSAVMVNSERTSERETFYLRTGYAHTCKSFINYSGLLSKVLLLRGCYLRRVS